MSRTRCRVSAGPASWSQSPTGPFKAEAAPIAGSFSIDPAVFGDTDNQTYVYFGGLWGGQLQRWKTGSYDPAAPEGSGLPDPWYGGAEGFEDTLAAVEAAVPGVLDEVRQLRPDRP